MPQSDIVVVGAGITGLTTAFCWLGGQAGDRRRSAVRWCRRHRKHHRQVEPAAGQQASRIAGKHGHDVLQAYVSGNAEGRDWLLRHCDDHGLHVQREDDHAYAQSPEGISTARSVLDACRDAGLGGAEWIDRADVPFPLRGGVRLPDQAQIDPMPCLNSLAVEFEAHGGTLLQGVRAVSVSERGPLQIGLRDAFRQPTTVGGINPSSPRSSAYSRPESRSLTAEASSHA